MELSTQERTQLVSATHSTLSKQVVPCAAHKPDHSVVAGSWNWAQVPATHSAQVKWLALQPSVVGSLGHALRSTPSFSQTT